MAVLKFPLVRTLFLPSGSPGIGCVSRVTGELREVRCGAAGGEVYCIGEADILIEYMSGNGGGGLFAAGPPTDQRDRGAEWQALLTLPFQLCGAGELPAEIPYRVNLGHLEWCMVAAHAVELETCVEISWDAAAGTAPQEAAALPEAEEELPQVDAPAETATEAEPPGRYIMRPAASAAVLAEAEMKTKQGGEWKMVRLDEERDEMQTTAPDGVMHTRRPIEIVDLGGDSEEESHIQAAIMRALATVAPEAEPMPAEEAPDMQEAPEAQAVPTEDAYTISMVFPSLESEPNDMPAAEPMAMDSAAAPDATAPLEDAEPDAEVDAVLPRANAFAAADSAVAEAADSGETEEIGGSAKAAETVEAAAFTETAAAPEQAPRDTAEETIADGVIEAIIEENIAKARQQEPEPYIVKPSQPAPYSLGPDTAVIEDEIDSAFEDTYTAVESAPPAAAELHAAADGIPMAQPVVALRYREEMPACVAPNEALCEVIADASTGINEEIAETATINPPAPERAPATAEVAADGARQPAAAPLVETIVQQPPAEQPAAAAEEAPRKKRRFAGLPGLYVQANNNDIDVTAFKINIKL